MKQLSLKQLFWIVAGLCFVLMLFLVPQYGISGDEVTQWKYGILVWNYMKSFGADKAVLNDPFIQDKMLQYYGGFFDGFAAMLSDWFHPKDPFLLRHYWNLIFGFAGIFFTSMIAKRLSGWRAALLTFVFLIFMPRFFGPVFNNPKDIPFATGYAAALLGIIIWLEQIKTPHWKATILLGLAIGLALSIRIGGVLVIGYFGLFYLVEVIRLKIYRSPNFVKSIYHAVVAVVIGWIVGCLWWPFGLENIIRNPIEALGIMADYPIDIKTLYQGNLIRSLEIPAGYLPTWLTLTTPILIILGFIGSLVGLFFWTRQKKTSAFVLLLTAIVLPIAYIIYRHSVVYDGVRHILFVLPIIGLMAALFFDDLLNRLSSRRLSKGIVWGGIVIFLFLPARFMFANHPFEYVYFNELGGGIKGAYGYYETDYYSLSLKQGLDWLIKNRLTKEETNRKDNGPILIASNIPDLMKTYQQFSKVPFQFVYVRYYEKNTKDWDYGIFTGRFLDRDELLNNYFPGSHPLHLVTADGVPLATVLENDPDRNGLKGDDALRNQEDSEAIEHFQKALKRTPEDLELWRKLALAELEIGNKEAAVNAVKRAYSISSLDLKTIDIAGKILMNTSDFEDAVQIFGKMTNDYPLVPNGYFNLGLAEIGLKNYKNAILVLTHYLEIIPEQDPQAIRALAYAYKQIGETDKSDQLLELLQNSDSLGTD